MLLNPDTCFTELISNNFRDIQNLKNVNFVILK